MPTSPYGVAVNQRRKRPAPPPPEPLTPPIDAHTHLDACGARTAQDVRAVLDRAEAVGVLAAVTIADDLASARWAAGATTWDDRLYAAVALHPTTCAGALTDTARSEIELLAGEQRVVAVGETGMDLYCWPDRWLRRAGRPARGLRLAYRPGQTHRQTADDPQPTPTPRFSMLAAEGPRNGDLSLLLLGAGDGAECLDAGWVLSLPARSVSPMPPAARGRRTHPRGNCWSRPTRRFDPAPRSAVRPMSRTACPTPCGRWPTCWPARRATRRGFGSTARRVYGLDPSVG